MSLQDWYHYFLAACQLKVISSFWIPLNSLVYNLLAPSSSQQWQLNPTHTLNLSPLILCFLLEDHPRFCLCLSILEKWKQRSPSPVWLFATPWAIEPMGFSRPGYRTCKLGTHLDTPEYSHISCLSLFTAAKLLFTM